MFNIWKIPRYWLTTALSILRNLPIIPKKSVNSKGVKSSKIWGSLSLSPAVGVLTSKYFNSTLYHHGIPSAMGHCRGRGL